MDLLIVVKHYGWNSSWRSLKGALTDFSWYRSGNKTCPKCLPLGAYGALWAYREHSDYFSHCFPCYSKHLLKAVPGGKERWLSSNRNPFGYSKGYWSSIYISSIRLLSHLPLRCDRNVPLLPPVNTLLIQNSLVPELYFCFHTGSVECF